MEVEVVSGCRAGCSPLVWVGSSCGILVRGSCGRLSEAHDRKRSCSDLVAALLLDVFFYMYVIKVLIACHFPPDSKP